MFPTRSDPTYHIPLPSHVGLVEVLLGHLVGVIIQPSKWDVHRNQQDQNTRKTMHSVHPVPELSWSRSRPLGCLLHQLIGLPDVLAGMLPFFDRWFACVGGAVVEDELIGVVGFEDWGDGGVDLCHELVGVVMEETILEVDLAEFWLAFVESDKEHVVLLVEVDLHGTLLLLHVDVEELEGILAGFDTQQIDVFRLDWRLDLWHGRHEADSKWLIVVWKASYFWIIDYSKSFASSSFELFNHHIASIFELLHKKIRFPIAKQVLRYKMRSILPKRSEGKYSISIDHDVTIIAVVALQNILEVVELEGGIHI